MVQYINIARYWREKCTFYLHPEASLELRWFIMHLVNLALPLLIVGAAALPATCEGPVLIDTRSLEEIYEAAQKEDGYLNVAFGGDEKYFSDAKKAAFEAAFPKIKLNITTDVSKYHDSRINRQYELNNPYYADIAGLQTSQDFDWWKAAGRLLPYKPPTYTKFWPAFTDNSEGYYMAFAFYSFGSFVYNPAQVAPADVPTSYLDLLDPKWKSKMIITYPNDDDGVTCLFHFIVEAHGWAWWEAFIKQDVQWVRGALTPSTLIARNGSTRSLSITTLPQGTQKIVAPAKDKYLLFPTTFGIFSSTTRPETSKLFVAWLTSDSVQGVGGAAYTGLSARSDIGPSVFSFPNADPTVFHKFLLDRKNVEQWRFQWETDIGTAQGLSSLEDNI